jgi:phosphate/sulfate permease
VARGMITAWVLTIPCTALIAAAVFFLLHILSGPIGWALHLFGV